MDEVNKQPEYDAIIIGSGTAGATIARELCKKRKKVLILERGATVSLKENFRTIASIANQVKVGDNGLAAARAITTGGSTSLYFATVSYPHLETFARLGIDLADELEAVKQELPITGLPDTMLGEKGIRLRDAATAMGHVWVKRDMLVDLSKCIGGYSYEAKWKAKHFVDEAISDGATLVERAIVQRILVESGRAIGVEYKVNKRLSGAHVRRVYGSRIILAAGELATPKILRDSGVKGVGDRGFYCSPGSALYGVIPGLNGADSFVSGMGNPYEEEIGLCDANMSLPVHRLMMLGGLKFKHLVSFAQCVGVAVKVNDDLGGTLDEQGRYYKQFDQHVHDKLNKGKQEAAKVLERAGATNVIDFGIAVAGRVGGLIRIGEHLDSNLETEYRNLHVCDGAVLPDDMKAPPTVTLVCMGKYLSKQLLARM